MRRGKAGEDDMNKRWARFACIMNKRRALTEAQEEQTAANPAIRDLVEVDVCDIVAKARCDANTRFADMLDISTHIFAKVGRTSKPP